MQITGNGVADGREVITTIVYKVSPEQREKLDRLAEERLKKASEEAISKIRERYEQRWEEIRQLQSSRRQTAAEFLQGRHDESTTENDDPR